MKPRNYSGFIRKLTNDVFKLITMMKKRYLFPIILLAGFLLGPKPKYESFDGKLLSLDIPLTGLIDYITAKEAKITNLKPDNQSRIVWADGIAKTEYSVVYLHGFSASPKEGDPIHQEFAKRYGANLYIPRLSGHGIQDDDAFKNLNPKDLIDSAKEAIAIGQILGDKVILMSCSTGGTLALYLAAANPDTFAGLVMYSPNIDIYDAKSELLTIPWGQQIASAIIGEHRTMTHNKGTERENYWTYTYNTQGLICLKYLIEHTMTETILSKVKLPYFLGYYYKNEEDSDHVVSIDQMKWFHKISATPDDQKRLIAFPEVGNHVMTSSMLSKDLESVRKESFAFAEAVLGLKPKEN
ncbi:MAG: esterase/lipase [Saprospiraceae bacterium]|jgi:esterase/lipase